VPTINAKKRVDGGPQEVQYLEVRKLETLMAGPLGGVGGKVRQRPPPKLKTSIAGPLGVLAARSGSGHHRS
jgi:hypothetical protein